MLAPLAKVRHQILRLLGSLGGQTNMLLLGNKDIDPSKVVAWDTENHLTFAVPFQDMKPNIYLGRIKTGLCLCFLSFPPQKELEIPEGWGSKIVCCIIQVCLSSVHL